MNKVVSQVGAFVVALMIVSVCLVWLSTSCQLFETKTSWQRVIWSAPFDNNKRIFKIIKLNVYGKSQDVVFTIQNEEISLYVVETRVMLLQEFQLPGKFISYSFDMVSDNLYCTVNDNGQYKLVVYQYQNNKYKLLLNKNIAYSKLDYNFSNRNSHSSDETITLVSDDGCKVQMFTPVYNVYYEYKHNKPFQYTNICGINHAFDGDRIFNIYKPEVTVAKFDYSAINFDSSKLDLNQHLLMNYGWFFNNGYLVTFDEKTFKALSAKYIGEILDIDSYQTGRSSNDISAGYVYITKEGCFKSDWKNTETILRTNNLTKDNIFYGGEYDFELYTMPVGSNTKFIAISYSNKNGNHKIEDLGVTPGKFQGARISGGYIYAYTTEGMFRNYYPHLSYLESRHSGD